MNDFINKKVLITTQNWFYGKDGRQYRAVHGTLKAVHEAGKTLGFIPNRSHANWFIEIGEMIIMGCQVMYIVECESINTGKVTDWSVTEGQSGEGIKEYDRPTVIYVVS
jgi:hypothetical protein